MVVVVVIVVVVVTVVKVVGLCRAVVGAHIWSMLDLTRR